KIDMFNFKATGTEKEWQPAHYIAFVLHAGQPEQVGLIDLGETAPIETAIEELRAGIKEHQAGESAKALYDLVFAPLLPELGEVKDIFISPDGSLNLIPFEVLIGPDDRFLIEEHSFTYLATGRDLIGNDERVASKQAPLIIGDPDFDFSGINAGAKDSNGSKPASESTSTSFIAEISAASAERGSHALSDLYFKRLPGTREEAEAIHALMGKVEYGAEPTPNPSQEGGSGSIRLLYTDKDALEEVLMNAEAPRILHLATHGFFLEDQEFALKETRRMISLGEQHKPKIIKDIKTGLPIENPLLRSGVVLAGVNLAIQAGQTEGVITAEKILGLKLQGTELVVLSACETGLGDVQVGEGVYGLRRVFLQAGAQSLVMSLWSVPDNETKELMTQFYRNFLSGDIPRNQALRRAMQQQMDIVKQRYGNPDPFYWGAFIFLGAP
ncbi:MAG: CHAT domain-containing protein, partial [bacterium]|nr:CHAT domain-containing protein [bacterium]